MGKKLVILLILLNASFSIGQEIDRSSLIKGTLTISPGFMLDNSNQPFYFHGILEGFMSEQVSITGEGSFYLGDLNEDALFRYNNSLFAGINYHLLKNGASDLFIGLTPGVSFTLLSDQSKDVQMGVNPVAGINIGYNYFMNEYFHFFLMGKTLFGKHSNYRVTSLNEFRFSAGLGFSIPTKKN